MDRNAIIERVARDHGVLLGQDDPILVTITIMDSVLADYTARVEASVARLESTLEDISVRHARQSRATAEEVVDTAAKAASAEIRAAGRTAAASMAAALIEGQQGMRQPGGLARTAALWALSVILLGAGTTLAILIFQS